MIRKMVWQKGEKIKHLLDGTLGCSSHLCKGLPGPLAPPLLGVRLPIAPSPRLLPLGKKKTTSLRGGRESKRRNQSFSGMRRCCVLTLHITVPTAEIAFGTIKGWIYHSSGKSGNNSTRRAPPDRPPAMLKAEPTPSVCSEPCLGEG